MTANLLSLATVGSLVSLTALETVLGIDNIIFLSILVGKLPPDRQPTARRLGLVLALGMRICLLMALSWLATLTHPLFTVPVWDRPISGRDLVLIIGGGFLITKSTWEIFGDLEGEDPREEQAGPETRIANARRLFVTTLVQIVIMDIVFSLDSVITAVGIAPHLAVMISAMVLSMLIMLMFAKAIGDFVNRHPSMKVLALSFLILIGTLLVAEGGGQHINKGYVYFAMAFAFIVEIVNLRTRKRAEEPAKLHDLTRHAGEVHEGHLAERVRSSLFPEAPPTMRAATPDLEKLVQEQSKRIAELEAKLARVEAGAAGG